jgi:hypothetical protein
MEDVLKRRCEMDRIGTFLWSYVVPLSILFDY